jgi:PAS domain S-box-containing protein
VTSLDLSELLSNPDFANGNCVGLELIVSRDGRLPDSAIMALGPELREALLDEVSLKARLRAIESGGGQRYRLDARGLSFDFEIEPSSKASLDDFICLKHRIVVGRDEVTTVAASRSVLDELPLAITIADRGGTIRYVNDAARRLVGVGNDRTVIGEQLWKFVHPEGLDNAHRAGWQVRMGQMAAYERHLLRRDDGSRIPVETTTQRTFWGGEEAILVASHDLSGVESVERALEESQRLFSSIFHNAPLAIVVSRNSDGSFVDVNPAFLRYLEMDRAEVVGKNLKELGIKYDREVIEAMRADLLSGRGSGELVESTLQSADGVHRSILCSAAVLDVRGESCMLTMGTDITELRRATNAVIESEQRFRLMADAAPVLIWLSDVDGSRTFVNRQWLEFVGSRMEDQLGDGWLRSVHPDDRDRCISVFQDPVSWEEGFTTEFRLRRHDGEYRWVIDRGTHRKDPDGSAAGFIGSCIDISDRREGEDRLREAKVRAEEMTILKSAFLTNMTHEIRTPLTVILGFTTILRQGTRPEYQRFISLIERSGRRLLLMLDSILDLAQLEAGTLKPEFARHNVADIANGVAESLRPIAEDKDIELSVRTDGASFVAVTDHAILSRVINNLIDNAVKFTESGAVDTLISSDNDEVRVEIRDTGIGIHEDFLPRIFDAFSQESTGLARTHQGSGLGLTVSAQLVELIGGRLTVKSEKGIGSTIQIRLPRQFNHSAQ